MGIVRLEIGRPGLMRSIRCTDFAAPLRFLPAEHAYLRSVVHRLGVLADDLHAPDRCERAQGILDYLKLDLELHGEDEETLLAALEADRALADRIAPIAGTVRREHIASERLLPPIIEGLWRVATGALPASPEAFAVSALIFCEFTRLHMAYEETTLFPVASVAMRLRDVEQLGHDMAYRRGMPAC